MVLAVSPLEHKGKSSPSRDCDYAAHYYYFLANTSHYVCDLRQTASPRLFRRVLFPEAILKGFFSSKQRLCDSGQRQLGAMGLNCGVCGGLYPWFQRQSSQISLNGQNFQQTETCLEVALCLETSLVCRPCTHI